MEEQEVAAANAAQERRMAELASMHEDCDKAKVGVNHLLLPSYLLARPSWAHERELNAPGALPQVDLARLLLIGSKYDRRARFDEFKVTKALEASFLNEAEIVFTTLNSSGRQVSRDRDPVANLRTLDRQGQEADWTVPGCSRWRKRDPLAESGVPEADARVRHGAHR
jgi:hypothetical protein